MTENMNLAKNARDHLVIGGCDAAELAEIYGTPLYVMDETAIRENIRMYRDSMKRHFGTGGLVLYASKAFCTQAMCRIAHQEGIGLDVVSGGEIYTAKQAGFPMELVYFHGNNKTLDELTLALELGVGRIVVDNLVELHMLSKLGKEYGKTIKIALRIKPGIDAHTHEFIRTGSIDSKFGVAIENGEAFEIAQIASTLNNISLVGIHCHIGSQIFDIEPFTAAAEVMIDFAESLKERLEIDISEINLGGGFGIKYTAEDDPVEYDGYIKAVAETISRLCEAKNVNRPSIILEPGRSIVGPAGVTIYKVGSVKKIPDVRTYVSVDGGMADNLRFALYGAKHTFLLANKMSALPVQRVTIAGKCCESGDLLGKDVLLPEVEPGDLLAALATGAYNYSMSMNYNRNTRPAVVLVQNGLHRTIVARETYQDLVRNDIIPPDLF